MNSSRTTTAQELELLVGTSSIIFLEKKALRLEEYLELEKQIYVNKSLIYFSKVSPICIIELNEDKDHQASRFT
jgi:hypothetical protein